MLADRYDDVAGCGNIWDWSVGYGPSGGNLSLLGQPQLSAHVSEIRRWHDNIVPNGAENEKEIVLR